MPRPTSTTLTPEQAFLAACRASSDPTDYLVYADWLAEAGREWDELWARGRAWVVKRETRGCPLRYNLGRQWHTLDGYWTLEWAPYHGRLSIIRDSLYNEWHERWDYHEPSHYSGPGCWRYAAWRRRLRDGSTSISTPPHGEAETACLDFYRRLFAWKRKATPNLWPEDRRK